MKTKILFVTLLWGQVNIIYGKYYIWTTTCTERDQQFSPLVQIAYSEIIGVYNQNHPRSVVYITCSSRSLCTVASVKHDLHFK